MSPPLPTRSILLTPPGTGAIGVVRVAGPDTARILASVFRAGGASGRNRPPVDGVVDLSGGRIRVGRFVDPLDGSDKYDVIDDVVISRPETHRTAVPGGARSPAVANVADETAGRRSAMVIDICAHGGVRIIERILETLERLGAPLAYADDGQDDIWPVDNLIQRDAVEALSRAVTARAARFLCWQWRHLAPAIRRATAASDNRSERFEGAASGTDDGGGGSFRALEAMLARYASARRLIHGATVALVGPPNSGKSTLLNRLAGRTAAVVSPTPGTTRDWVTAPVTFDGVPITLVDTAGKGDTADPNETEAILRGVEAAGRADLSLILVDASVQRSAAAENPLETGTIPGPHLIVATKTDLVDCPDDLVRRGDAPGPVNGPLGVSSLTGRGIDELRRAVLEGLGFEGGLDESPTFFCSRQVAVVERRLSDLRSDPRKAARLIGSELVGDLG
ncbi:MAG: GTPase [Phycisphaerae bacterium]